MLPLPLLLTPSALSEVIGSPLPYDDVLALRDRMWEVSPTLVRYDELESPSPEALRAGLESLAKAETPAPSSDTLKKPVADFYRTDPISRASVTMAQCSKAFSNGSPLNAAEADAKQASYA